MGCLHRQSHPSTGHQCSYELERCHHTPHACRSLRRGVLVMAFSSFWPKALKSDLEGQRRGVPCLGGDIDSSLCQNIFFSLRKSPLYFEAVTEQWLWSLSSALSHYCPLNPPSRCRRYKKGDALICCPWKKAASLRVMNGV